MSGPGGVMLEGWAWVGHGIWQAPLVLLVMIVVALVVFSRVTSTAGPKTANAPDAEK
jgi:hypothetical protein